MIAFTALLGQPLQRRLRHRMLQRASVLRRCFSTAAAPRHGTAIGADGVFGGGEASTAAQQAFGAWHSAVDSILYNGAGSDEAMQVLYPHMEPKCILYRRGDSNPGLALALC